MSLIAVSPRKTGVALNGAFDANKFIQILKPNLAHAMHWIDFYDGLFFYHGHAAAAKMFLTADPSQGFGAQINSGSYPYNPTGIGYGGDGATLVATFNNSPTTATPSVYVSYDLGATWTARPVGSTQLWRHPVKGTMADGTPVWVLDGGSGMVARSVDNGWTWQTRTTPISMPHLAFGVGKFVGANGSVSPYYSTDGAQNTGLASWTKSSFTPSNSIHAQTLYQFSSIRFVHDRFFYLERVDGIIGYSFDGQTWFEIGVPATGFIPANVIYGAGLWIILGVASGVGSNSYLYSLDGTNWSVGYFPAGFQSIYGAFGNDMFVFGPTGTASTGINGNCLVYKL